MKTSIKENIKRNITIGGLFAIFVILVGWIWSSAQWQQSVDTHMENANKKNELQDEKINKIYEKFEKKNTLYVPRNEFDQVIKRLDERNSMIIDLLKEIKKDVKRNSQK